MTSTNPSALKPRMKHSSSSNSISTMRQSLQAASLKPTVEALTPGSAAAAYAEFTREPSPPPYGGNLPSAATSTNPLSAIIIDDIPAEVECYENQRYYPIVGWSRQLLPTDRPSWSTQDGLQSRQFTDFKCPRGWQWTSDWCIDCVTTSSDSDGWSYAVEFTKEWQGSSAKTEQTVVRRRRWYRKRAAIPGANINRTPAPLTSSASLYNKLGTTGPGNSSVQTVGGRSTVSASTNNGPTIVLPYHPASSLTMTAYRTTPISRAGSSPSPLSSLYTRPSSANSPSTPSPITKVIIAVVHVYEYHRYYPIVGWSEKMLPTDKVSNWMDSHGRKFTAREIIQPDDVRGVLKETLDSLHASTSNDPKSLTPNTSRFHASSNSNSNSTLQVPRNAALSHNIPSGVQSSSSSTVQSFSSFAASTAPPSKWHWSSEWTIEKKAGSQGDGWQYAIDFTAKNWSEKKSLEHFVRRRLWRREKQQTVEVKAAPQHKKTAKDFLDRLDKFRNDLLREEEDEDLVALSSATW